MRLSIQPRKDTKGEHMSETRAIVQTLKKSLRAANVTYADVATALALSESSVKRLFSDQDFSLKRLDQICQLMNMEISDLMRQLDEGKQQIEQLSLDQEQLLVSDLKLLVVAICALNHWSFDEIVERYTIEKTELIQCLAKLDKLLLIELLPNNKIKLLIAPHFSWIKNGPIQRYFESQVQTDFLDSSFNGKGELRVFTTGMLSRNSNTILIKRMERLAQEFRQFHNEDSSLPLDERFGTSMVLAIRPWELTAFESLRRVKDKRVF